MLLWRKTMSIVQKAAKNGNKIDSKLKYLESIKNQKTGTRKAKIASLNNFDYFCSSFYNLPSSEILIQDMLSNIELTDGIFQIIHNWIQWNVKEKKLFPTTISIYLVCLRKYLHQRGVKIDREDLANYFSKNNTLKIPLKEKKYPVKLFQLQEIIGISPLKRKQLYLFLISSGMRISEALLMKKKDVSFEYDRIMVTIPAENSKNREERITFLSEESRKYCQPLFDQKSNDELVFGTGIHIKDDVVNHAKYFANIRKKLGYFEKYKTGTSKITLHSMRAFFISKIIKQNENLGHYLAGHSVYMKQYERFEIEELIEAYKKSEPELTILDLTRKDDEITRLQNVDFRVRELEHKLDLYHKLVFSFGIDSRLVNRRIKELGIQL